jgi:hypothetical protein
MVVKLRVAVKRPGVTVEGAGTTREARTTAWSSGCSGVTGRAGTVATKTVAAARSGLRGARESEDDSEPDCESGPDVLHADAPHAIETSPATPGFASKRV